MSIDQQLDKFDEAWHDAVVNGTLPPEVAQFLPDGVPERKKLALELSAIDLERRLDCEPEAAADDYLSRYAELREDGHCVLELKNAEISGLRKWLRRHVGTIALADVENRVLHQTSGNGRILHSTTRLECGAFDRGGTMGAVAIAQDTNLKRQVAVKAMKRDLRHDSRLQKRLVREAEITGRLQHPGVPPVHALGKDRDDRPWFAMKLVEGKTLSEAILQYHAESVATSEASEVSLRNLLANMIAIANTIQYAHEEHGVVHRDLKPTNVMVGNYGETIVIDWGLGSTVGAKSHAIKRLGLEDEATDVDGAHTSDHGSRAYMAPEALADESIVSPTWDVYALGAILFEILYGISPYQGKAVEEIVALKLAGNPPEVPAKTARPVPRALERVWRKAMCSTVDTDQAKCHKARTDCSNRSVGAVVRYKSAAEFAKDLQSWLDDVEMPGFPDSRRVGALRWLRHHPRVAGFTLAGAALATLVLVLGAVYYRSVGERTQLLTIRAEELIAAKQFDEARVVLIEARSTLSDYPGFNDLKSRISRLLGAWDHQRRFTTFEAVFNDAQFHLLGAYRTPLDHEQTATKKRLPRGAPGGAQLSKGLQLADQALALVELTPDSKDFGLSLTPAESKLLKEHVLDLLLLKAIAIERVAQGRDAEYLRTARIAAIELLDSAEAFGSNSRYLYEMRARMHRGLGDAALADIDAKKASSLSVTSALDHHFRAVALTDEENLSGAAEAFQQSLTLRANDYWTLFRLAKTYEDLGNLESAQSLYRSCIALRPSDPTAYNNRAKVLSDLRRFAESASECQLAIEKDPDYLPAYGNWALAFAELGQPHDAETAYALLSERTNVLADERSRTMTHVGLAYERQKDYAMANSWYEQALEVAPENLQALRNSAIALRHLERTAKAEERIRKAIALQAENGELWSVLGEIQYKANQRGAAIESYGRAVELDVSSHNAWYNRGVVLREEKRFVEALECQNRALAIQPSMELARFERAMNHANLKNFEDARKDLDMLVDRQPESVEHLLSLGKVLGDIDTPESRRLSEQYLTQAIKLVDAPSDAYRSRAVTRMKNEDWQGAIADFQKYLVLVPNATDTAGILSDISTAWLSLGQAHEAMTALNESLALNRDAAILTNRGNLFLLQSDLRSADTDFSEAIILDKGHLRAWALRGACRIRRGQYSEAVTDLTEALELEPSHYETLALRAIGYYQLGQFDTAKTDLAAIINDRPTQQRGLFARGMQSLLDGRPNDAIGDLSAALSDVVLRPYALELRAKAWTDIGGKGYEAAATDAEQLAALRPLEGVTQYDAAKLLAALVGLVPGNENLQMVDKCVAALTRAVKSNPTLRDRLAEDAAFLTIRRDDRFKELLQVEQ